MPRDRMRPTSIGATRDSAGRHRPTTLSVGPGPGILAGSGTICKWRVSREGDVIVTTGLIDLTGLAAAAAGDIIGTAGVSYLGRITAAVNGVILGGTMYCSEAPATGDADIDLYSAPDATGAYDGAITGLSGDVQATNAGTLSLGTTGHVIADSIDADDYLYLVSVGATTGTYTAGRLVITLYGNPV